MPHTPVDAAGPRDESDLAARRVACVVTTWNNARLTRAAMASLLASDHPNFFLIAVDNGSRDETLALLAREFPEVLTIVNGRNLGFAAGCNLGIDLALASGADEIFLLNNDAEVAPDCLSAMSAAAAAHPEAGILGARITSPTGPPRDVGRRRSAYERVAARKNLQEYGASQAVPVVWGCGMLLTRRCLEAVGGFDETFFAYDEDRDLCVRARRARFAVRFVREAHVTHLPSQSTGGLKEDSAFRAYLLARNRVRLWRKHGSGRLALPGRVATLVAKTLASRFLRANPRAATAALAGLWEGLTAPLGCAPRFPARAFPGMARPDPGPLPASAIGRHAASSVPAP